MQRRTWTLKTEEGWEMYINIKQLKEKGFSKTKIAEMLGISRPTVIKYASMDAKEYENEISLKQIHKLITKPTNLKNFLEDYKKSKLEFDKYV